MFRLFLLLSLFALSACQLLPTKQGKKPAAVKDVSIDKRINPKQQEQSVIQTMPLMKGSVKSLYQQANVYFQEDAFDKAIASLERAYEIQPSAPKVSSLLAEISLHQGRFDQAYYWADIATKNSPSKGKTCMKSWRILAIAAEKLGYSAVQEKALNHQSTCRVSEGNRF